MHARKSARGRAAREDCAPVTSIGAGSRLGSARTQGILVFVLATVLLTVQDALTKLLTAGFTPIEVLFYRGWVALVPVGIIVAMSGGRARLRTQRPWVNIARGLISLVTSVLVVGSFVVLPLAEALAIIFVSPLILTVLSGPALGERATPRQWGAVAIGFVGAVLIIRPSGDAVLAWSTLIPLAAAVCSATRDLVTRRLGATDHPSTVLLYSMVTMALGSAVITGWHGTHLPSATEWSLILGAAVLVTGAYFCQIIGLKLAAAAVIAPYRYVSLVWGGLLGWGIWDDVMPPVKLLGCGLVVASGLHLLREKPAH